tara:strand:+ start:498 stop:680 length:183 start_codon:yes stop_codon:yes gene_type:complete
MKERRITCLIFENAHIRAILFYPDENNKKNGKKIHHEFFNIKNVINKKEKTYVYKLYCFD